MGTDLQTPNRTSEVEDIRRLSGWYSMELLVDFLIEYDTYLIRSPYSLRFWSIWLQQQPHWKILPELKSAIII